MELANHYQAGQEHPFDLRPATHSDLPGLSSLMQTAPNTHLHIDWHLPRDWIGTPGFIVVSTQDAQQSAIMMQLTGPRRRLQACLAATADPPPAAWVRMAAVSDHADAAIYFENMLQAVLPILRERGVQQLAWLGAERWPQSWLRAVGFTKFSAIETYIKHDLNIPLVPAVTGLEFRPAQLADMEQLAAIETAAFDPIWRHSSEALRLAKNQSLSFDVALLHEKVAGFQLSTRTERGAHLVRMALVPALQGQGVGSALLAHALTGYQKKGMHEASLNTQIDNVASQALYTKFGFRASGQRVPIWMLDVR